MGIFLVTNHDQYIVEKSCGIYSDGAPLYKTARIAPISLKYYGFCMKNGKYRVRLHFAEIMYGENKDPSSKGNRFFDVAIQDQKVLENFNIREAAMGVNRSVTLDFVATVRNHRLEIHLYWTGKGSIHIPVEYYGPLISAISVSPVPRKSSTKPSPMSIAALVGSALLLLLLISILIVKLGCLGGKELNSKELKDLEFLPGGSFNFRQIKAATQNFNPVNKIGEGGFGSVYKVCHYIRFEVLELFKLHDAFTAIYYLYVITCESLVFITKHIKSRTYNRKLISYQCKFDILDPWVRMQLYTLKNGFTK
ncbi:probable LRR receptor-like serine/threonine-protein kinase At1g07650 [Jatropha curcas]|uniref:probable LRR receptor-like serine/threonine-protein kinase At1g07650 n=1 Tax=Jatropha curcas TaxID=180498 RepID=UPI001895075E|nr:probable LRR receptor-like serine/threonine-protein kinase At1g07650 [Jatropha curcas]